jgi:hypothetical protein
MASQHEYNEWFKWMLSKHLTKQAYKLTAENHEGAEYLAVTISHPDDSEKDIVISTYGRELTLFFWRHHEHHDSFEDDNHEEEFIQLFEYIDDMISDKVFFAVAYKGDKVFYGTASYDFKSLLDKEADRLGIKSWSGKHDQIIEIMD